jgi:hypothetical protein
MVKDIRLDHTEDTRERRTFEIERGQVTAFRLQLEVRVQGKWKPVIRWDTSHGFVDRDRYNLQGEKRKVILNVSFKEGLARAQDDLNANWHIYRRRFLEGLFP